MTRPMTTPVITQSVVTTTAMYSEVRMPYSSIVNTSRPSFGSTPNQNSPDMPPKEPVGMAKSSRRNGYSGSCAYRV